MKGRKVNFKIIIDCSFMRDDFENRFLKNYSSTTTKNVVLHFVVVISLIKKIDSQKVPAQMDDFEKLLCAQTQ